MADRENDAYETHKIARQRRQRCIDAVICVLGALLLVLLMILFVSAIADSCAQDSDRDSVETGADEVKFGTVSVSGSETQTGALVLSNILNAYTARDDDSQLTNVYDYRSAQHAGNSPYSLSGMFSLMNKDALAALDKMLTECYAQTGTKVLVRVAYMTEAERKSYPNLLPNNENMLDWKTGLGAELRIQTETGNAALSTNATVSSWLEAYAASYGFVQRYPNSKAELTGVAGYTDYYRYVGVAHATYMKQNDLCLEEYIERLPNYTSKDRLTVTGVDGKTYEIYYCAVSGDTTISAPSNYAYTLSGTNKGGLIVTIDRTTPVSQSQPSEIGDQSGTTTSDTLAPAASNATTEADTAPAQETTRS